MCNLIFWNSRGGNGYCLSWLRIFYELIGASKKRGEGFGREGENEKKQAPLQGPALE